VSRVVPSALIIVENDTVPADSRVWAICLSLRRAGWEITVVSPRGAKRDRSACERIDGVDIHRFHTVESSGSALGYLREYVLAFARIRRLVRMVSKGKRFDVVHACNPPDFLFLTALRLRRQGAATVFDQHDLSPELHAAKYEKDLASRWALVLLERLAFSLADVTLAMNESFRDVAVRRGSQLPENVFIVRNGPDLKLFEPVEPDPALRSGSKHLLGYVGVMSSQDGIDLAVEALGILRRRRSDWHAVLVGDGDVLADAERAVQRLGLQAHVTFTGYVRDRVRLAQIISTCDVCLSPEPRNSLNEKSTLVKVAEYMAVGRPVVAFDLTETRRTAGEAAVYAERDGARAFADAIDGLLNNPERRARMGQAGRERARSELGWNRSEEALIEAYERALERATLRVDRRSRFVRRWARDANRS
jgi:glycosyltransferase involved in cell wall biosynthesis